MKLKSLSFVIIFCNLVASCSSSKEVGQDILEQKVLRIVDNYIKMHYPEFYIENSVHTIDYTDKLWIVAYSGPRDRGAGKMLTSMVGIVTILRRDNLEILDSRYN